MQKKIIALAVAGLASTAAFAQSNVTVYGVADVYYGVGHSGGAATRTSVNSGGLSGSRLGFKGTEDLGNGLKALFTLEYGLTVDDNTGVGATNNASGTFTGNARQQFVGLTGGFGTALAGRLQTAGYDFSAATNVFHGAAINPLATVQGGFNQTTLISSSSRASNALAYVSPSFGGFVVAVNHARLTETAVVGNTSDGVANLVSGTYTAGPAVASLIYTKANNGTTQFKEWGLGGGYDFGVVNLKASYQSQDRDGSAGKDKAWQVSGAIPVTAAGKVLLGYAKNTVDSVANQSDDTKSYTLAYLHSLSKRTTLYTGYQHVSNDNRARVQTALTTAFPTANTTDGFGGSSNGFVAGVNHAF